jgi:hypothetical protein
VQLVLRVLLVPLVLKVLLEPTEPTGPPVLLALLDPPDRPAQLVARVRVGSLMTVRQLPIQVSTSQLAICPEPT